MSNEPMPDILSMPEYGISVVQITTDENGMATYEGSLIRTADPHSVVNIPKPPSVRAFYVGDKVSLLATDAEGVMWRPMLTDKGWMRVRV